jgi:hypothetical protein
MTPLAAPEIVDLTTSITLSITENPVLKSDNEKRAAWLADDIPLILFCISGFNFFKSSCFIKGKLEAILFIL